MEGTCKCGGRIRESNHHVETQSGAMSWTDEEVKLPLHVETSRCQACGRVQIRLIDAENNTKHRRA